MRVLTQARTRTRVVGPAIAAQEHVMALNYREQRQLHSIESRLLRSDPHLAAMLTVFGRLAAGQRMPGWEQAATRLDLVRQAAALIAKAAVTIVTATSVLVTAVVALFTALIVGGRARLPQATRQETGSEPTAADD
jgi:Protein of unknown function (DUF3040)